MSRTRTILLGTVAAAALGVAGYAFWSPAFAAQCKAAYSQGAAWVKKGADAAASAYKKTGLHTSVQKELQRREAVKQQKAAAPKPALKTQRDPAAKPPSAAELRRREQASWSPGQRIANSVEYKKHHAEFGFKTPDEMAAHVDRVVSFASPSNTKQLSRGRTAYWDDKTWSIVIIDPKANSGGTTFKPKEGRPYFRDLK